MEAIFIGIIIMLGGGIIMANAAFSDRSQNGFLVCLAGLGLLIGGIIELIF
ncbi:hypothetical protein GLP59_10500 [Sulfitobacter sp. M220]|jgi:hypothetical protein|uniref:hypothetical protein n=1 Tax=Sulfitobacter sp. M220 TaxID=2675333 RepID=UPI001F424DDB|nr:hypothetical protein [Sulfitobacter sp. M220]MCF7778069.1 hypothetical protein [Sulfitobacter sp. M220]